jgi:hypothetical protein
MPTCCARRVRKLHRSWQSIDAHFSPIKFLLRGYCWSHLDLISLKLQILKSKTLSLKLDFLQKVLTNRQSLNTSDAASR